MARFLKQSFAQTCLKETDNGKLHHLIIEMSPRFVLGRENVPCVAEVVNRSLKADCTDFTYMMFYVTYLHDVLYVCATSILFLFSQRDHNENKVYPDLYYAIPATVS